MERDDIGAGKMKCYYCKHEVVNAAKDDCGNLICVECQERYSDDFEVIDKDDID